MRAVDVKALKPSPNRVGVELKCAEMQELHSCETICAARNKERNAHIAAAVANGSIAHCCDTLLCHFTISTTTATLQL
jgi:hypothetical protein